MLGVWRPLRKVPSVGISSPPKQHGNSRVDDENENGESPTLSSRRKKWTQSQNNSNETIHPRSIRLLRTKPMVQIHSRVALVYALLKILNRTDIFFVPVRARLLGAFFVVIITTSSSSILSRTGEEGGGLTAQE
jgi:hypothetical protein